jgi:hypothetical protein
VNSFVALVDAAGNQTGVAGNPLAVTAAPSLPQTFNETASALAISASFAGPWRAAAGAYFTAQFRVDQSGATAFVDFSNDGVSSAGAANGDAGTALSVATGGTATVTTLQVPVVAGWYRARLVNGATAQAKTNVNSAFQPA